MFTSSFGKETPHSNHDHNINNCGSCFMAAAKNVVKSGVVTWQPRIKFRRIGEKKQMSSSETVNVKAICYIGKVGCSLNELFPDPVGSVIQDFERHAVLTHVYKAFSPRIPLII